MATKRSTRVPKSLEVTLTLDAKQLSHLQSTEIPIAKLVSMAIDNFFHIERLEPGETPAARAALKRENRKTGREIDQWLAETSDDPEIKQEALERLAAS